MANDLTLPGAGEASGPEPAAASASVTAVLARLPAVDRVIAWPALADLVAAHGQPLVKRAVQGTLDELRSQLKDGGALPAQAALAATVAARVQALTQPRLRQVINLTGTVIHTNLGRALLGEEAIDAVAAAMRGYVALEYDIASGGRGDRDDVVGALLCELTGAEAATVVNNCAAAVLLTLKALAVKRDALISRGELIEIGGAFRMPEIMQAAGCRLVEVGTTNRTHLRDFEAAITARTGLVVKAHTSNYAVSGFTASVDEAELARLAHARGVPFVIDLGSGALIDLARYGLPAEPLPQQALAAGADVVMFSGDKLLGGPQAGIIVGRKDLIARIKKDPLKRAVRVSKLTLAALEATLRIYASAHRLPARLPTLALLTRTREQIRTIGERLLPALQHALGAEFEVRLADCASQIGSGAQPVERLPSAALAVAPRPRRSGRALQRLEARLRGLPLPVLGRIHDDELWLDLRCLLDEAQFLQQLARLREPC